MEMCMEETGKTKYTDEELCELIQAGDMSKKNDLLESCRGLVFDIVGKCDKNNHSFKILDDVYTQTRQMYKDILPYELDEDLTMAGYEAVFDAATRYKHGSGATFKTFAHDAIKGNVLKELVSKTRPARVSSAMEKKYRMYSKEYKKLNDEGKSYYEIMKAICDKFKTSPFDVEEALGVDKYAKSLDQNISLDGSDDGGLTLGDIVEDPNNPVEQIEKAYWRKEIDRTLDKFIDTLEPEERQVLIDLYGLRGHEKKTIKQIAEENGRTRNIITKIRDKALAKLKEMFKTISKDTSNFM